MIGPEAIWIYKGKPVGNLSGPWPPAVGDLLRDPQGNVLEVKSREWIAGQQKLYCYLGVPNE